MFNPVVLAHKVSSRSVSSDDTSRALTPEEWSAVLLVIEQMSRATSRDRAHYYRARWVFNLLYCAFLRRDEAVSLRMGDFQEGPDGWGLHLTGKGGKRASIVVPQRLIRELRTYRLSIGLSEYPHHGEARPAVCRIGSNAKGISSQALYLICQVIFARAAELIKPINPGAAARLEAASPHWMRHTGITHALERGINPRYVQAQARHASLVTTAKYDHQERRAWRTDFERF
jgi:integrase